jgi:hypothetical protein
MLWFVLCRKLPGSKTVEWKVAQLNTGTLELHGQEGWHVVLGGFHIRDDADEAYKAFISPSTLTLHPTGLLQRTSNP